MSCMHALHVCASLQLVLRLYAGAAASLCTGGVCCRGVSKQWMMGESLLVSPVIQKDTEELAAHFTTGTW